MTAPPNPALVMTVGTGVKGSTESLVRDLSEQVIRYNCKTYFVCTAESKRTVEEIKKNSGIGSYNTEDILLGDCDEFDKILAEMKSKFKEVRKNHSYVTLNYTSGTKSMSAAAVFAAIIEGFDALEYLSGKREEGIVKLCTKPYSIKTAMIVAEIDLKKKVVCLFQKRQYGAAKDMLEEMSKDIDTKGLRALTSLAKAYDLWDKFRQKDAFEELKKAAEGLRGTGLDGEIYRALTENIKFLKGLNEQLDALNGNMNSLKELNEQLQALSGNVEPNGQHQALTDRIKSLKESNKQKKRECYKYYLADLINNSERRLDEQKFDDAVARMYRTVEMLAEWKLLTLGHDLENFDPESMPEEVREKWKSKIVDGKLKIALKEKYELLRDLNCPYGKIYEESQLRGLLQNRNQSILAHGISPVGEDCARKLLAEVKKIIDDEEEALGLKELQKSAKFVELEDVDWVLSGL